MQNSSTCTLLTFGMSFISVLFNENGKQPENIAGRKWSMHVEIE